MLIKNHSKPNFAWKKRQDSAIIPLLSIMTLFLLGFNGFSPNRSEASANSADLEGFSSESAADDAKSTPVTLRDASVSLIVSMSSPDLVLVSPGEVAYRKYKVEVMATNIEAYTLSIASVNSSANLSSEDGAGQLTGANNKTPAEMSDNTWGYNWGSINSEAATYATLPTHGNGAILSGSAVQNNAVSFSKDLSFAAKFGRDIPPGNYHGEVALSLVVTPRALPFADITEMQQMTAQICANTKIGDTAVLIDSRDNNPYNVRKHEDGNCWMTQNLRLKGGKTLIPATSDVSDNYTLATSINGGTTDNAGDNTFSATTGGGADQSFYRTDTVEGNGVYYSWTAATAGTGEISMTSGDASGSICPKGWKLPPNSGNGSYANLTKAIGVSANRAGSEKLQSSTYDFHMSGLVLNGGLYNVGSYGYFWLRTAGVQEQSYHFTLHSTTFYLNDLYQRYRGYSVRCVAVGN